MLAILMQIAPLFIIILIGILIGKWNNKFGETTVSELNS
jgi:predicted permease